MQIDALKAKKQPSPESPVAPADQPGRLVVTGEHLLFGGIILLAAVLRFVALGALPFSPAEAGEALPVWAFWQPGEAAGLAAQVSPAYFSLNVLLTQVLGFSDSVMRLLPAAAGLLTVVLVWLLRPVIGRYAAAGSALLLAVSPTLTATSRTAGGESLAILAILGVAVCWLRGRRESRPVWGAGLAVSLGLGLTSAPLFYSGLFAFGLTLLVRRWLTPDGDETAGSGDLNRWGIPTAATGSRFWKILAAVALGAGTLFLWYLPGIGLVAALPVSWLASFNWRGGMLFTWLEPFLALVRYEFPVVLPGLPIAFWAIWRGRGIGVELTYWLIGLLLLLGLQFGFLPNVALLALPAYLLIGVALEQLVQRLQLRGDDYLLGGAQLAGLLLILAAVVAANLGRYARISLFDAADVSHLALAILCLLIGLIVWATLVVWDRPVGLLAGLLAVLGIALVVNWNGAWRLATWSGNDPREHWVRAAADDDLPYLVRTIDESARELSGSTQAVSLFVALDRPLLRWYLRDFERVTWGEVVPVGETADFVITPSARLFPQNGEGALPAAEDPPFGADYIGSDFALTRFDQPTLQPTLNGLRWWLFGQSPAGIVRDGVTLWIRADLLSRPEG